MPAHHFKLSSISVLTYHFYVHPSISYSGSPVHSPTRTLKCSSITSKLHPPLSNLVSFHCCSPTVHIHHPLDMSTSNMLQNHRRKISPHFKPSSTILFGLPPLRNSIPLIHQAGATRNQPSHTAGNHPFKSPSRSPPPPFPTP